MNQYAIRLLPSVFVATGIVFCAWIVSMVPNSAPTVSAAVIFLAAALVVGNAFYMMLGTKAFAPTADAVILSLTFLGLGLVFAWKDYNFALSTLPFACAVVWLLLLMSDEEQRKKS
jgi:hypothetical protein